MDDKAIQQFKKLLNESLKDLPTKNYLDNRLKLLEKRIIKVEEKLNAKLDKVQAELTKEIHDIEAHMFTSANETKADKKDLEQLDKRVSKIEKSLEL